MIRSLIIAFLTLLLLNGCNQSGNLIEKHYSNDELAELDNLSDFIIDEMSKDCEGLLQDCLYQYFEQFKGIGANEEFGLKISQDAQKRLIDNLDKTLFDDIWIVCKVQRSTGSDSLIKIRQLYINHEGRFARFLMEMTENRNELRAYAEPFKFVRDYTPAMNSTLLKSPDRFDFLSKDEFLLVTTHLLTLNYPEEII